MLKKKHLADQLHKDLAAFLDDLATAVEKKMGGLHVGVGSGFYNDLQSNAIQAQGRDDLATVNRLRNMARLPELQHSMNGKPLVPDNRPWNPYSDRTGRMSLAVQVFLIEGNQQAMFGSPQTKAWDKVVATVLKGHANVEWSGESHPGHFLIKDWQASAKRPAGLAAKK